MSTTVTSEVVSSAVARLFADLNAERMDSAGDLFSDDATLRAPAVGRVAGRAAILDFFTAAFRPFATHVEVPTRILVSDTTATVEMRFDGTTADGRSLTFDGVDILDFDTAGLITALSSWNDSLAISRQLRAPRSPDGPVPS
jgi:ketosteroid isomerase-like protein